MKYPGKLFVASLLALGLGAGAAYAQVNAYVANSGATRVDVVDTATNTVTATITESHGQQHFGDRHGDLDGGHDPLRSLAAFSLVWP